MSTLAYILSASLGIAAAVTPLPQRAPDRWVYDTAGVIDPADETKIEGVATELFRRTGVAVVVLTVPRLVDETIDDLAVRTGQDWGVGRKGQDRGLVVALSRDDRKIYVATGYGTEGYLPDGRVGGLIDRYAMPHLRANRSSQAMTALVGALAAASAAEYGVELSGVPPLAPEPARPALGPGQIIAGVLLLLVVIYLAIRHPWLLLYLLATMRRGGGGGGGGGHGGFGGGGFGGGGAGRDY